MKIRLPKGTDVSVSTPEGPVTIEGGRAVEVTDEVAQILADLNPSAPGPPAADTPGDEPPTPPVSAEGAPPSTPAPTPGGTEDARADERSD